MYSVSINFISKPCLIIFSLDKLVIEVNDVNVFVGCKKELTVKGYDKYYNPVTIDTQKIK